MFTKAALLTLALLLSLSLSQTAFAQAETKEKEKMKEKEKEEKPPKEKKTPGVEWQEAATIAGTIKNTTTVTVGTGSTIPRNGKATPPPTYVTVAPERKDFSVETAAWRIKWNIEETTERGAKLKVILYKEEERGKSKDWKKKGMIPARPGSEGEQVMTLGPGNYYFEMTGNDVKYSFTIEEAHKTAK